MNKTRTNKSTRAVIAVLVAATLFGTSATARELSNVTTDSDAIAFVRLFIGSIGLLLFAGYTNGFKSILTLFHNPWVWVMALGVSGYPYFFFVGTDISGVAFGTLISLALAPFFTGLFVWLWKKRVPRRIWILSTAISVLGLLCLSYYALESSISLSGVLASLLASIGYAIYTVVGSETTNVQISAVSLLAVSFFIASLVFVPFTYNKLSFLSTSSGLLLSVWLGLLATALAYVFFAYGLEHLRAGEIATLNLAEPLVAALLGILVLGETLGTLGLLGCGLITAGLAILAWSER
jgi:DME family drug/metabolite transporter